MIKTVGKCKKCGSPIWQQASLYGELKGPRIAYCPCFDPQGTQDKSKSEKKDGR